MALNAYIKAMLAPFHRQASPGDGKSSRCDGYTDCTRQAAHLERAAMLRRVLSRAIAVLLSCAAPCAVAQVPLEPQAFTAVILHVITEKIAPSAKLSIVEPLSIRAELTD